MMLLAIFILLSALIVIDCNPIIFTVYESDRNLRELIGSIHHQGDFRVKVFGYKHLVPPGILDEITLWRGVQFIDISQQILYTTNTEVIPNMTEHFRLCMVEYLFEEEMADRVIFIQNGRLFDKKLLTFDTIDDDIKGDGYEIFCKNGGYKEALNIFRGLSHKEVAIRKHNNIKLSLPKVDSTSKWSCSIKVRSELVFSGLFQARQVLNGRKNTKVALLIPSKNENSNVDECALVKYFIPSFLQHTKTEKFAITVYVGYDVGDLLLSDQKNKDRISNLLGSVKIKFIELPQTGWLTFIWNFLFVEAYADGNDFFVQLNDDIRIESDDWLDSSTMLMTSDRPGVVGFNDLTWQCKLYTQTLVSRSHYRIFAGQYFPLSLRNWYSDNWITEVYGSGAKCNEKARVSNGHVQTRYEKCDSRNYEEALKAGRAEINQLTNSTQ